MSEQTLVVMKWQYKQDIRRRTLDVSDLENVAKSWPVVRDEIFATFKLKEARVSFVDAENHKCNITCALEFHEALRCCMGQQRVLLLNVEDVPSFEHVGEERDRKSGTVLEMTSKDEKSPTEDPAMVIAALRDLDKKATDMASLPGFVEGANRYEIINCLWKKFDLPKRVNKLKLNEIKLLLHHMTQLQECLSAAKVEADAIQKQFWQVYAKTVQLFQDEIVKISHSPGKRLVLRKKNDEWKPVMAHVVVASANGDCYVRFEDEQDGGKLFDALTAENVWPWSPILSCGEAATIQCLHLLED